MLIICQMHATRVDYIIVLLQTSPESPGIFMLLQRLFSEERPEALKSKTVVPDGNITDNDFQVAS